MENIIEIPKGQVIMAFVATCIEATARLLKSNKTEKALEYMERAFALDINHYSTQALRSLMNM